MANNLTGVFETLVVPAATDVKLTPKYKNTMLGRVYTDYRGQSGTVGNTLQINVPIVDENNVANIGAGPINIVDTNQTPVNIVIAYKMDSARIIKSFDQVRTVLNMRELYVQPMIEEVLRKSNRVVANLATPTLFPNYATIAGGSNVFTRLNISAAWQNVAGTGGAPVNPDDTSFVTDQTAYGNMLGDATQNFIQQYVVGESAAIAGQQKAMFAPQFSAMVDWDQQMPTSTAGKHGGLYFHRMAIGLLPVLEPQPEESYIRQTTIFPTADRKFPITVQMWHDPTQQGTVLNAFATFGVNVINPAWGSYLETV